MTSGQSPHAPGRRNLAHDALSNSTCVSFGACVATSRLQPFRCFAGSATNAILPFDECAELDAVGLATRIQLDDIRPLEALNTTIERAEAVNDNILALVGDREILYEQARQAIERGPPDGPLAGVPYLLKDLSFAMSGAECSAGSALYKGVLAHEGSTAVKPYRAAGLVIFGRTHSPEFGIMRTTETALYGITRNPWTPSRRAGGSSVGSAAAVAACIVPAASGSDGGGSIRIPASYCGLFGLKLSRERIPCDVKEYGGLVSVHAITRTVRDSAALLGAARGPLLGMTNYPPIHKAVYLEEVSLEPRRLKIGITSENRMRETCIPIESPPSARQKSCVNPSDMLSRT